MFSSSSSPNGWFQILWIDIANEQQMNIRRLRARVPQWPFPLTKPTKYTIFYAKRKAFEIRLFIVPF